MFEVIRVTGAYFDQRGRDILGPLAVATEEELRWMLGPGIKFDLAQCDPPALPSCLDGRTVLYKLLIGSGNGEYLVAVDSLDKECDWMTTVFRDGNFVATDEVGFPRSGGIRMALRHYRKDDLHEAMMYLESIVGEDQSLEEIHVFSSAAHYLIQGYVSGFRPDNYDSVIEDARMLCGVS